MSETGLKLAQDKMVAAGIPQQAIDVFTHYYRQLEEGVSGFIPEDTIEPLLDPSMLSDAVIPQILMSSLRKQRYDDPESKVTDRTGIFKHDDGA